MEVVLRGQGDSYAECRRLFKQFSHSLYSERWGEVASYLRDGLPILFFLRASWDEVAYSRGMDDPSQPSTEDGFSVHSITEILQDDFFCVYWQMQMRLRDSVFNLLRWAEGCPCHEELFRGASPYMRDMKLRSEVKVSRLVPCRCPMAGCRAPEIVAGELDRFAERLRNSHLNSLMATCGVSLAVEQWDKLKQEWERGASYVIENLKLRLAFFQHLPWVILGGCHHDLAVAKAQLGRAKEVWISLPQEARSFQHCKAKELFQEGPMQEQLNAFIDTDCMLSDCPLLEAYLAPLTFVQITERIIEAAHKEIGDVTAQKSATQYSITLRVPELIHLMERDEGAFAELVQAFSDVRSLRQFPMHFQGHGAHPDWLALGSNPKTWQMIAAVRKMIYRDSHLQHGDVAEAANTHEQLQSHKQRVGALFREKDPTLCEEMIFAEICTKHLRDVSSEDNSQVVSIANQFLMPLLLRPSAVHRPVHAPCTVKVPKKMP